ncbi:hypothetical protein LBMAG20_04430 [Methylocystaceae bacterium]|nr:hypothetical protein LBMAG20_04430 [Methylocystaceae bacterium]
MIMVFKDTKRRSRTPLRLFSYPSSARRNKKSLVFKVIIQRITELFTSIVIKIKTLQPPYKFTYRYAKFSVFINDIAPQLDLQNIPKVGVEIFCNKSHSKVAILINSKPACLKYMITNDSNHKAVIK